VLEAHLAATELDEVYTLLQDLEVSAELFNAADEKLKQAGFGGTLYGLLKILAEGACESFFYEILYNAVVGLAYESPRYTQNFKNWAALIQSQRCGTAAINIMRSAGFPLPSESTNRRTIRGSATSSDGWGVCLNGITDFHRSNPDAVCCALAIDGTDIAPELSERMGPKGYEFVGDHCTEGVVPDQDQVLLEQQDVYNEQMMPLDAFLDDPTTGIDCIEVYSVLSSTSTWLSGHFSKLAHADLERFENVVKLREAKFAKT
jgi:hypothetical protein